MSKFNLNKRAKTFGIILSIIAISVLLFGYFSNVNNQESFFLVANLIIAFNVVNLFLINKNKAINLA